jgi:hypothetical protein
MKFIGYVLIAIMAITAGCKSRCNNCTQMDANKAQQIELSDHYVPWWIKK